MRMPRRKDVTRTYTEQEAFAHASTLYKDWITRFVPSDAAEIVAPLEVLLFRPATQLQLAGLTLLSGEDLEKPVSVAAALACFTVDHLLWGWRTATIGQVRVAFTLCRASVESAIFTIASGQDFPAFEKVWKGDKGTGGEVLRSLLRSHPEYASLHSLWKSVVDLGHASTLPVTTAAGTLRDGSGTAKGMSFAGQYAGPLDAAVLENLARVYCLASVAGAKAMAMVLAPRMRESTRWTAGHTELAKTLGARVPVPAHLRKYVEGRGATNDKPRG